MLRCTEHVPLLIPAAVPIEHDEHVVRARRSAAKHRIAVGLIGITLIVAQPQLLPYPALGLAGLRDDRADRARADAQPCGRRG